MPMTSQEMIKLLLKNGFAIISQNGSHVKLKNTDTHKTVIVPYHCKDIKKRSGTGNSETSWLKITNIDKENQNEKTFLSGTFS